MPSTDLPIRAATETALAHGITPESVVADSERDQVEERAFVIRRLKPLPIEAIVRGYVVGSGWKDYQQTGAICGIPTASLAGTFDIILARG